LFLTYCEAEKQSKTLGKAAVIKNASSKEYDSRTLEGAVRKVLQEHWTSLRASKYYVLNMANKAQRNGCYGRRIF
jgi:hypothetical protein